MSFNNTAPCFLTFYCSDQSLLPFLILFTFMLHFVVGTIMYSYNTVKHSVNGANNCIGANYCKALI